MSAFPIHSVESAPDAIKGPLEQLQKDFGFIPIKKLTATTGGDTISGTENADILSLLAGDDVVIAGAGMMKSFLAKEMILSARALGMTAWRIVRETIL